MLASVFLLVAAPAVAQDGKNGETKGGESNSAEALAERIQGFYSNTRDFQANFVQTYHDLAAGSSKVSRGKVYIKKPGRMRWDYTKKDGKPDKLYVSDGTDFWVYEYDFQQVFKQCLKNSQLKTSLAFLMGEGNLLKEFDVRFATDSSKAKPKLRLKPKEPTAKYKELEFTVDPETYQVTRTILFDPYGNMNEIVFSKPLVNKNLPDSGFDFKPPKGARVLNPNQECP
jgi:outer membrane lipoprotein carrier protein